MPGPAEVIKCKRVGSYYILVGYGAFTENVRVESPDRKISIQVSPSKGKNILPQSGGLIEWRLANGRPFAVIARFAFYDGEKILEALSRGETPFQADFKTGESFVAKGLTSKPQIDFEVWVNTPNARRKIRALVDGALNLPDVPLTLPVVPPPL